MRGEHTTLLADADVLIDYRESAFDILELIVRHIGKVVVLSPVLDEVKGVTEAQCTQLGIEVVEIETAWLTQAAEAEPRVSFNDYLCLMACIDKNWTCVTNDSALRRLCARLGVATRFGLGLMVDLVAVGALTRRRAMAVARQIQKSNPLHINERVIARFTAELAKHNF